MTTQNNICPVCNSYVTRQEDGLLFPHFRYSDSSPFSPYRYTDGGGPAVEQARSLIPCEGAQPAQAPALDTLPDHQR